MAIDVLAVMDADIARRQQTAAALSEQARPICERLNFSRIEEMRQARAAVAELIEKSAALATAVAEETEYFATHKHLDEASFFENRVVQCTDELRAALARMGEGA